MVFILMKVQAHFSSKKCHKTNFFLTFLNDKNFFLLSWCLCWCLVYPEANKLDDL